MRHGRRRSLVEPDGLAVTEPQAHDAAGDSGRQHAVARKRIETPAVQPESEGFAPINGAAAKPMARVGGKARQLTASGNAAPGFSV